MYFARSLIKFTLPAILVPAILIFFSVGTESSIPRIFSSAERSILREGRIMTFVYMKGKGNASSNVSDAAGFLNISALPDGWGKYDVVLVEKAYLKVNVSEFSRIKIFNTITARSRIRGMMYYSISEKRMAQLILESSAVRSCDDRSYVPDHNAAQIPALYRSYFTVKDNRMGRICFNATVEYMGGMFVETDVSCGKVSRLGMRVFNDSGYVVKHYIVPDESGGGYFYCSVQIMKVESSIMKKLDLLNPENFGNRVRGETVHFFRRMGYDISSKAVAFR